MFSKGGVREVLLRHISLLYLPSSNGTFRVQRLQRLHPYFSSLQGGYAFGSGPGGGERCDGWDARGDGGSANRLFVEVRVRAVGRVDDELDAIGFDEIDGIGAALLDFIDAVDSETGLFETVSGAVSGDQFKAHVDETAGDLDDVGLVVIGDADEDGALRWKF